MKVTFSASEEPIIEYQVGDRIRIVHYPGSRFLNRVVTIKRIPYPQVKNPRLIIDNPFEDRETYVFSDEVEPVDKSKLIYSPIKPNSLAERIEEALFYLDAFDTLIAQKWKGIEEFKAQDENTIQTELRKLVTYLKNNPALDQALIAGMNL